MVAPPRPGGVGLTARPAPNRGAVSPGWGKKKVRRAAWCGPTDAQRTDDLGGHARESPPDAPLCRTPGIRAQHVSGPPGSVVGPGIMVCIGSAGPGGEESEREKRERRASTCSRGRRRRGRLARLSSEGRDSTSTKSRPSARFLGRSLSRSWTLYTGTSAGPVPWPGRSTSIGLRPGTGRSASIWLRPSRSLG